MNIIPEGNPLVVLLDALRMRRRFLRQTRGRQKGLLAIRRLLLLQVLEHAGFQAAEEPNWGGSHHGMVESKGLRCAPVPAIAIAIAMAGAASTRALMVRTRSSSDKQTETEEEGETERWNRGMEVKKERSQ